MLRAIAMDANLEEDFTAYHRTLRRHFYKGKPGKSRHIKEDDEEG